MGTLSAHCHLHSEPGPGPEQPQRGPCGVHDSPTWLDGASACGRSSESHVSTARDPLDLPRHRVQSPSPPSPHLALPLCSGPTGQDFAQHLPHTLSALWQSSSPVDRLSSPRRPLSTPPQLGVGCPCSPKSGVHVPGQGLNRHLLGISRIWPRGRRPADTDIPQVSIRRREGGREEWMDG